MLKHLYKHALYAQGCRGKYEYSEERNDVKNKTAKNKNIISDMKISLQKK